MLQFAVQQQSAVAPDTGNGSARSWLLVFSDRFSDRFRPFQTVSDRWFARRIHIALERQPDPRRAEQVVQEAIQMGFEEAAVRAMQAMLGETSTEALIEALISQ